MSCFNRVTTHPETGEIQLAFWVDDYFGRHQYGVRFPDGKVFRESEIEAIEVNGVGAQVTKEETIVKHWDGSMEVPK